MAQSRELFTERLKCGYKNYFFNVREGAKGSNFVIIAESVPGKDGKFQRSSILIGEDDLKLFRDTLNEIIGKLKKEVA